jgi:hypothetical protein
MRKMTVLVIAVAALAGAAFACGIAPTPTATPPPTLTPLPVQAPGWEEVTVHVLCLEVEQSYPEIEGKNPEPIAEAAQRILAGVGLQMAAEGASCDATLRFALTGVALGAQYFGGGYCYSGAEMNGDMTLAVSDRTPLTLSVTGRYPTPTLVHYCPPRPADAPFGRALATALLDGLAQLWGPQTATQALEDESADVRWAAARVLRYLGPEEGVIPALVRALGDEDEGVRMAAVFALGDMGPEAVPGLIQALEAEDAEVREAAATVLGEIGPEAAEAVPALIETLDDGRPSVREAAAEALVDITGQDFGEDAATWRRWWEEHQPDTPAPPTSECTPDASFEADVTIPDGTQIEAGQSFVKTWRMRNTGTCDWDADYRLVFVDGEQMGGPDSAAVPDTQVGESAEISVALVAPQEQGKHHGYWRMCVGGVDCFGDRIYVEIVSTE